MHKFIIVHCLTFPEAILIDVKQCQFWSNLYNYPPICDEFPTDTDSESEVCVCRSISGDFIWNGE